jgi:hypothetical protein
LLGRPQEARQGVSHQDLNFRIREERKKAVVQED